jgi:predicted PolB exonuclease-like 3'-5' exonuclease
MSGRALVFDLETVPDATAFARAEQLMHHPEREVRRQMGEKVARPLFHRIVCIGSLLAERGADGAWRPAALEAPHLPQLDERALVQGFVDRLRPQPPQLVTFNGHAFDLPVLRYRAMMLAVSAPGLAARAYFDRAGTDTVDLCHLLSAQQRHARVSLDQLSRALGLPGKPAGVDGTAVESLFAAGKHEEIAAYCESDVVNTYRCWLRYELFCGRLDDSGFSASEQALTAFLSARG